LHRGAPELFQKLKLSMKDQEIWHQYLQLEEIIEAWEGGNGTTIAMDY